jgi:uncharacterized Tic20 family protein
MGAMEQLENSKTEIVHLQAYEPVGQLENSEPIITLRQANEPVVQTDNETAIAFKRANEPEQLTGNSETTIALPQAHELTEREKEDAMGAYLMMFAAWGAGFPLPLVGLIASIIYFYLNKKSSPFTAFHSYQALLTHIPISVLNAAAVIWGLIIVLADIPHHFRIFGAFCAFAGIWNALYMAFSIIACVQARKGRFYYFWVFGRLSFTKYYLPPRSAKKSRDERNLPPEGM